MSLVANTRRTSFPSGLAGDDLLIEGVALDSLLMEDGTSIILLETN
jgi:hypothetical protein